MSLVSPIDSVYDATTKKLAGFLWQYFGYFPNSVLTMELWPAISKAFNNLNMAVWQMKEGLDPL